MSVVDRADAAAERLRSKSRDRILRTSSRGSMGRGKSPLERFEKALLSLKPHRPAKQIFESLRLGGHSSEAAPIFPSPGSVNWAGIPLSLTESRVLSASLKAGVTQQLYHTSVIRVLDLSNCGLGPAQAAELGRALATLPALEHLNLRGNPLMSSGVVHVMTGLTKALGGQEDETGSVMTWGARSSAGALGDVHERLAKHEAQRCALLSAHSARSAVGSRTGSRQRAGGAGRPTTPGIGIGDNNDSVSVMQGGASATAAPGCGTEAWESASQAQDHGSDGDEGGDRDDGGEPDDRDGGGDGDRCTEGGGTVGVWDSVSNPGGWAPGARGAGSVATGTTNVNGRGIGGRSLFTAGGGRAGTAGTKRVWTMRRSPLIRLNLSNVCIGFDDAFKAVQLGMGELPPGGCMVPEGLTALGQYLAHPQCSVSRLNLSKNVLHPVVTGGFLQGLTACASVRSLSIGASKAPDGLIVPLLGKALGFTNDQVDRILQDPALNPQDVAPAQLMAQRPGDDTAAGDPALLFAYVPGIASASALTGPLLFETPGITTLNLSGCRPSSDALRCASALLLAHERARAATLAGVTANRRAEAADAAVAAAKLAASGPESDEPAQRPGSTSASELRPRYVRLEEAGLPEFVDVPSSLPAVGSGARPASPGSAGGSRGASAGGVKVPPTRDGAGSRGPPHDSGLWSPTAGTTGGGRRGSYSRTAHLQLQMHPHAPMPATPNWAGGDGHLPSPYAAGDTVDSVGPIQTLATVGISGGDDQDDDDVSLVLRADGTFGAAGHGASGGDDDDDDIAAILARGLEATQAADAVAAAVASAAALHTRSGASVGDRPKSSSAHGRGMNGDGGSVASGGQKSRGCSGGHDGCRSVLSISKDMSTKDAAAAMKGQLADILAPPTAPLFYDLRGDSAPTLRRLKLRSCGLGPDTLPFLFRGFRCADSCVRELDVGGNPLGPTGAHQLAELLTAPGIRLADLGLSGASVTRDGTDLTGVDRLFAALDECNTSLASLDLSNTVLLDTHTLGFNRPASVHALIERLSRVFRRNRSLVSLDLRGAWLGPHAARLLQQGLRTMPYAVPHAKDIADVITAWVDAQMVRRARRAIGSPQLAPVLGSSVSVRSSDGLQSLKHAGTRGPKAVSQATAASGTDVAADNVKNANQAAVAAAARSGTGVKDAVAEFLAKTRPGWERPLTVMPSSSTAVMTFEQAAAVAAARRGFRIEDRIMHAGDASLVRKRSRSALSAASGSADGASRRDLLQFISPRHAMPPSSGMPAPQPPALDNGLRPVSAQSQRAPGRPLSPAPVRRSVSAGGRRPGSARLPRRLASPLASPGGGMAHAFPVARPGIAERPRTAGTVRSVLSDGSDSTTWTAGGLLAPLIDLRTLDGVSIDGRHAADFLAVDGLPSVRELLVAQVKGAGGRRIALPRLPLEQLPSFAGAAPSDPGLAQLLQLQAHALASDASTSGALADYATGSAYLTTPAGAAALALASDDAPRGEEIEESAPSVVRDTAYERSSALFRAFPSYQTPAAVTPGGSACASLPDAGALTTATPKSPHQPRLVTYSVLMPDASLPQPHAVPLDAVPGDEEGDEALIAARGNPPDSWRQWFAQSIERPASIGKPGSAGAAAGADHPEGRRSSLGDDFHSQKHRQIEATISRAAAEASSDSSLAGNRASRSTAVSDRDNMSALASNLDAKAPRLSRVSSTTTGQRPPSACDHPSRVTPSRHIATPPIPAAPSARTPGRAKRLVDELLAAASRPGVSVDDGYVRAVVKSTKLADLSVFDRKDVFGISTASVSLKDLARGVSGVGTNAEDLANERRGSRASTCDGTAITAASRTDERRLSVLSITGGSIIGDAGRLGTASTTTGGRANRGGASADGADGKILSRYAVYDTFPGLYGRVDARTAAQKLQVPPSNVKVIPQETTRGMRPGTGSHDAAPGLADRRPAAPASYSVHSLAQLKPRLILNVLEYLGEPRRVLL